MAKHKRPQKTKSRRSLEPAWNDLEQAFFASAPPDEPEPAAEPEQFDDLIPLIPPAPSRRRWTELGHHVVAALSEPRLDLRLVTIGIASIAFLIGLSAVVFASLR